MHETTAQLPKIALLGRPNVGKSTLFNVLSTGRENKAVTHALAGTTRDVRHTPASLFGQPFVLLDTAGVEQGRHADDLQQRMNALSLKAAAEADVLILLLDGQSGLTPADRALAAELRRLDKPLLLVVNKADTKTASVVADEAESLGFGAPILLSAAHREGMGDLSEALQPYLPPVVYDDEATPDDADQSAEDTDEQEAELLADADAEPAARLQSQPIPSPLKLAVLGRPNVGKSTLVNALLRDEVMLTGPTAGLTREAIRHGFQALGHEFALIDTPGLRRKSKIEEESIEHLMVGQSLQALGHAHVVLLVLDASVHNEARGLWQVFEQQDATIAQACLNANKPLVVVLNKWDAVADKAACKADVLAQLRAKLHDIHTPLVATVSATEAQGLGSLLRAVLEVQEAYGKIFNTAKINRTLAAILAKRSPPLANGRPVSLKFLRQICAAPPTFALWGNRVDEISGHYLQFLKHQLAENLGLTALPITLHLRTNKNPFAGRKRSQAKPGAKSVGKAASKPAKQAPGKKVAPKAPKGA